MSASPTDPSPAMPAQGSAAGPPPAHGPALGNWPMIVRVDLTALLKTIHEKLPLDHLLQEAYDKLTIKLDKETRGNIDITSATDNEEVVQQISAELMQLLGIPADSRCAQAADVLKINCQGAIGVYMPSNLTKAHGHFMGVLNLRTSVHGDDLIGSCRGVHDHVRGLIIWPRGGRKGLRT